MTVVKGKPRDKDQIACHCPLPPLAPRRRIPCAGTLTLEVEYLTGAEVRRQFELRAAQFGPLIKRLNINTQ